MWVLLGRYLALEKWSETTGCVATRLIARSDYTFQVPRSLLQRFWRGRTCSGRDSPLDSRQLEDSNCVPSIASSKSIQYPHASAQRQSSRTRSEVLISRTMAANADSIVLIEINDEDAPIEGTNVQLVLPFSSLFTIIQQCPGFGTQATEPARSCGNGAHN